MASTTKFEYNAEHVLFHQRDFWELVSIRYLAWLLYDTVLLMAGFSLLGDYTRKEGPDQFSSLSPNKYIIPIIRMDRINNSRSSILEKGNKKLFKINSSEFQKRCFVNNLVKKC